MFKVVANITERIIARSHWKTLLKIFVLTVIQIFATSILMELVGISSPEMTLRHPKFFPTILVSTFIIWLPFCWWLFVINDYVKQIELPEKKK